MTILRKGHRREVADTLVTAGDFRDFADDTFASPKFRLIFLADVSQSSLMRGLATHFPDVSAAMNKAIRDGLTDVEGNILRWPDENADGDRFDSAIVDEDREAAKFGRGA